LFQSFRKQIGIVGEFWRKITQQQKITAVEASINAANHELFELEAEILLFITANTFAIQQAESQISRIDWIYTSEKSRLTTRDCFYRSLMKQS
jgi:hypothetical protein